MQKSTACGKYDSHMLRPAATGSSAKELFSRRPVLR